MFSFLLLMFRKPCSGFKWKEMTGSGIFAADSENGAPESGSGMPTPNNRTGLRTYQVSFGSNNVPYMDLDRVHVLLFYMICKKFPVVIVSGCQMPIHTMHVQCCTHVSFMRC